MLKQRIITALILAPVALAGVFLLPPPEFAIFTGVIILIGAWEWANLAGFEGHYRYIYALLLAPLMFLSSLIPPLYILVPGAIWWALAFYLVATYGLDSWKTQSRWNKALIGPFILIPAWISLVQLKQMPDSNYLILLLFFLIWGADIGAYFAGRAFGKRKLAPRVSPGKSWAGVAGGLLSAAVIAMLMSLWAGEPVFLTHNWLIFLIACLFVVGVSILGDLTISLFKRERGVKDSSALLPGHGGILDRIDSLVAAGPYFALFMLVLGRG